MDYIGLVKRAWDITVKHRYLWILGILVSGTFSQANFRLPYTFYSFRSADIEKAWPGLNNVISGNLSLVLSMLGLIGIFGLIFMIVSIISQAGIIEAVRRINQNETNSFGQVFWKGFSYFWRLLAITILLILAMCLVIGVFTTPVIILIYYQIYWLAILLGILFALVFIAFIFLIGLIVPYISRIIVLENQRAIPAICQGINFFKKHWLEILAILLLCCVIGIIYFLALAIIIGVLGLILVLPAIAIYTTQAMTVFWLYVGLALIILFGGFVIINGFYQAFLNSIITLVYLDLKNKNT